MAKSKVEPTQQADSGSVVAEATVIAGQDAPLSLTEGQAPADTSVPELPAESVQASAPGGHSVEGPEVTALDDAIPALWIRSVPPTFRRCGFAFSREGIGIAMDALDEDQVERLVNEPNLVVEHSWFTDRVQE